MKRDKRAITKYTEEFLNKFSNHNIEIDEEKIFEKYNQAMDNIGNKFNIYGKNIQDNIAEFSKIAKEYIKSLSIEEDSDMKAIYENIPNFNSNFFDVFLKKYKENIDDATDKFIESRYPDKVTMDVGYTTRYSVTDIFTTFEATNVYAIYDEMNSSRKFNHRNIVKAFVKTLNTYEIDFSKKFLTTIDNRGYTIYNKYTTIVDVEQQFSYLKMLFKETVERTINKHYFESLEKHYDHERIFGNLITVIYFESYVLENKDFIEKIAIFFMNIRIICSTLHWALVLMI